MLTEALQSRLRVLEDEILRLARLASQETETTRQDDHLRLAQDLNREARELRSQIRKISESEASDRIPAC
jgi:TolA-binding protein